MALRSVAPQERILPIRLLHAKLGPTLAPGFGGRSVSFLICLALGRALSPIRRAIIETSATYSVHRLDASGEVSESLVLCDVNRDADFSGELDGVRVLSPREWRRLGMHLGSSYYSKGQSPGPEAAFLASDFDGLMNLLLD